MEGRNKTSIFTIIVSSALIISILLSVFTYLEVRRISGEMTSLTNRVGSLEETMSLLGELTGYGELIERMEIVQGAKAEGELSIYYSEPMTMSAHYSEAFQKKYPFIKVNWLRDITYSLASRTAAEVEAGKETCDVITLADPNIFDDWGQKGWLMNYNGTSQEYYPAWAIRPGNWTSFLVTALMITYNTELVTAEEAPKNWTDVLDPKWKGKIGMVAPWAAGTAYSGYYALRTKYGLSFVEGLAEQGVRIYEGNAAAIGGLTIGEVSIVILQNHNHWYTAKLGGKPIDGNLPADGVPVGLSAIGIMAGASHPNAAKLFYDWYTSEEAVKMHIEEMGTYSPRIGSPPPTGLPSFGELNIMVTNLKDEAAMREQYLTELRQVLGIPT